MLFPISNDSPLFDVFIKLNQEMLFFLEQAIPQRDFCRELFTEGNIGQACFDNAKANDIRASNDLTCDKFQLLFDRLQFASEAMRRRFYEVVRDNQDLSVFFANPNRDLLTFLPRACFDAFKIVMTHLYCATKDLQPIIDDCDAVDISAHFESFRASECNGNICKACGMKELSPFRANTLIGNQWRADYDHQLCKSKYPVFAVHPDNLIPLCDICNQDAKKSKDLFVAQNGTPRLSFNPYNESAFQYVDFIAKQLKDPEPHIVVIWATDDREVREKLESWNDIYEIKNLVEGRFINVEKVIEDEINPVSFGHMLNAIADRAREPSPGTLKRKEWAFWYYKLFCLLNQLDLTAFWEKSKFMEQQGEVGGDFIMNIR